MEKKKVVKSYQDQLIDTLSSGYDAKNVDGEQVGLAHEQEVAVENNWGGDKRDEVGRAAYLANKKKRLAKKLFRISRELEAIGNMESEYHANVEECEEDPMAMEMGEQPKKEPVVGTEEHSAKNEKWLDADVDTKDTRESSNKSAVHPIQHDSNADDPAAFASSEMGDAEWISIGPGTFDDKRDEVGKASK